MRAPVHRQGRQRRHDEADDDSADGPAIVNPTAGGKVGPTLDFSVVYDALPMLLWGCLGTFQLALSGMTLAMVIGVGGVVTRDSRLAILRGGTKAFIEIIRNTPFLVQIFFLFFALPNLGLKLNPTQTSIIALGVNGGA